MQIPHYLSFNGVTFYLFDRGILSHVSSDYIDERIESFSFYFNHLAVREGGLKVSYDY